MPIEKHGEIQGAPGFSRPWRVVRGSKGFTLLELVIVFAIISILIIIAFSGYNTYVTVAKVARAISEVRNLDKSISAYVVDTGSLPDSLERLGPTPIDPWGRPYQFYIIPSDGTGAYLNASGVNPLNTDYDLYSKGVDGQSEQDLSLSGGPHSQDDVVRAYSGSFVELGSKAF